MSLKLLKFSSVVAVAALTVGCGASETPAHTAHSADPAAASEATAERNASEDIVAVASGAGSFDTLVAAVKAADLVATLQSEGPFTVFAPTDDAFAKLPPGTVEDLLKPENKDKLTAVLTYHVVPGKLMAKDVIGASSAKTVQGQDVAIRIDGDTVMIDKAKVLKTDIPASNGVIHVIDSVILPQ